MKVLVFGTFDQLHPGHLFLLNEANSRGDLSIVVAQDETVRRIKNKFPQQNQSERISALHEKFPDAEILKGDAVDYLQPLQLVQPDLVLLGYDQQLPPGVTHQDFRCAVERLDAFEPEKYKSSILRSDNDSE